jgi:TonB family protein
MTRKYGLGLLSAAVWVLAMAGGAVAAEKASGNPASGADSLDQPPKFHKQQPPEYPLEMRMLGLSGEVIVEFSVDQDGNVQDPYAIQSNNPWFERAAISAIEKWKFTPGLKAGRPVKTTKVRQKITFRIDDLEPRDLWKVTKGKDYKKLPAEFQWDVAPVPVNTAMAVYPLDLLQAGTKGQVTLGYIVGPDGTVVKAEAQEATTPEMGLAALAMIDVWRFVPARKDDGTPCYAMLGMILKFSPSDRGNAPVGEEARRILKMLNRTPDDIHDMKDLDSQPKPRSRRPPVFPSKLRKLGQTGSAEIEFFIDRNGDAQLPRIISATASEFGYAAAQAVATWRYDSPLKDGKKVVTKARIPINFTLK